MDLLTSSFHSDYGNYSSTDNKSCANVNETFAFPDDLIDLECMLAGRESFSIDGRDSLGILQNFETLVLPKLTLEPIREARVTDADDEEVLRIFHTSPDDDRESLGVLWNGSREDRRNSFLNVQSVSSNLLNIGYRLSSTSSVSSPGSVFRPSLWSLDYESDELSKIFSINSRENVNSLNVAFYCSNKTELKMENSQYLEKKETDTDQREFNVKTDELNDTVFSESKMMASIFDDGSILEDLSDDLYLTRPPELIDIAFDDNLYELTTHKNADVILKTVDILFPVENCTNQASANFENTEISPVKLAEQNLCENQVKNDACERKDAYIRHENSRENDNIDQLTLPRAPDILNTSFSPRFSNNRNSSNSRSLDPRDLLNNLSNIISTEMIENQSQVKRILQDLADVLLVPNCKDQNDDSGRSSIEENDVESLKYCSDENVVMIKVPENAEARSEKRLSQSFCFTSSSKGVKIESAPKSSGKTRQRSLEDLEGMKKATVKKLSMPNVKLRLKKNDIDSLKKGPMKAIVPLANMKRRSIVHPKKAETPPKKSLENSYLKKRTSTPNTWNAVPVAQSTPEQLNHAAPSPRVKKSLQHNGEKSNLSTTSQLSKSTSLNTSCKRLDVLNRSSSTSAPNISRGDSPSRIPTHIGASSTSNLLSRRRSVGEIKYTPNSCASNADFRSPLARFSGGANSVGMRDAENAHALKKDMHNTVSSVGVKEGARGKMDAKIGVDRTSGVKSYLSDRNRNLMQYIKPLNLLDKMKK